MSMKSTSDPLGLADRTGLPDALRVLAEGYPREGWEAHGNFDDLTRFWLDRHLMFRRLQSELADDARALLERNAEPVRFAQRTSRLAGMLINQLHGHHQIEDHHYFPLLSARDLRLIRGFDLLDSDHHELDERLNALTLVANTSLQAISANEPYIDATAAYLTQVERLASLLDRHLTDEEELIVPILLEYGPVQL
jgi:iron-sulfur cluster repair protein YtfE (RIC family)